MLYLPKAFPLRIAGASAIAVQPWGGGEGIMTLVTGTLSYSY